MCGLAGILAFDHSQAAVDGGELLRMREQMKKRGPNGAGLWLADDNRVGLAHRRLAVIDPSERAAQPMASPDGRFHIVFNGAIYNYRELRAELEQRGVVFFSQSDTEVLLQLYARERGAMCNRLRGMYAFAIWDTHEQSLFLARDPFGIKPLYLHEDGQLLRFASQVKALLAGGAVAPEIDPAGEYSYWIWGHVAEPGSLYKNIRALTPGSWYLFHRDGRRQQQQFVSVENLLVADESNRPAGPVQSAAPAGLREILLDSVRHHLVADVPVGVFLSAGIDSCALAALAAEVGHMPRAVTLGFEEYRGSAADETVLAQRLARQLGAEHHTVWISRADFEDAFAQFLEAMDQPTIDGLNTWLVSRAAAQLGLKVVLSGLGGDELFGGYPSFRQLPAIRRLARPFATMPGLGKMVRRCSAPLLRRVTSEKYAGLLEYGASWEGAYMLRRALRMPWELPREAETGRTAMLLSSGGLAGDHAIVSSLEVSRYMRNQLLRDSDWAAMAHSLELRVPFVDLELTRHIAAQRRAGTIYTKRDLVAAAAPPLATELVGRKKTGFSVPVRDWLLADGPRSAGRGLRDWSRLVYDNYTRSPA